MSTEVKTNWYENIEQGTFHELVAGSDTERRIRSEQRNLVDEESGEEYQEQAYRKVTKAEATSAPSEQPGYVKGGDTPASPVVATVLVHPQTPTADTNAGPLIGEPGAEEQAAEEIRLGGAPRGGVKPSATAAKKTVAQGRADKADAVSQ
jgi:hypothetical protein